MELMTGKKECKMVVMLSDERTPDILSPIQSQSDELIRIHLHQVHHWKPTHSHVTYPQRIAAHGRLAAQDR
jgi:hypothetical protein